MPSQQSAQPASRRRRLSERMEGLAGAKARLNVRHGTGGRSRRFRGECCWAGSFRSKLDVCPPSSPSASGQHLIWYLMDSTGAVVSDDDPGRVGHYAHTDATECSEVECSRRPVRRKSTEPRPWPVTGQLFVVTCDKQDSMVKHEQTMVERSSSERPEMRRKGRAKGLDRGSEDRDSCQMSV